MVFQKKCPPRIAVSSYRSTRSWAAIDEELMAAQGRPVDLGGYYRFDAKKVRALHSASFRARN